jgi:hypothetical protein
MDEFIDTLAEKVINSISGYSFDDQAFIITELTDRLLDERGMVLLMNFNPKDEDESEDYSF